MLCLITESIQMENKTDRDTIVDHRASDIFHVCDRLVVTTASVWWGGMDSTGTLWALTDDNGHLGTRCWGNHLMKSGSGLMYPLVI